MFSNKLWIMIAIALYYSYCSQFQLTFTLLQYHHVTFYISPIKDTLGANLSLDVAYLQTTSNTVSFYSSSFTQTQQARKFSIWNFQNSNQVIVITVAAQQGINLTSQIMRIQKMQDRPVIAAAIDKTISSGYMLPFNMLNSKTSSLYVNQYNATPEQRVFNLQPFMSTYWGEIQSSIQIYPHFPYLSQCSIQKSYIILSDLIEPESCEFDSFHGIICADKNVDFSCIMEQLQISNVGSQFWFNKDEQILFYLFEKQLKMTEFIQTRLNLQGAKRFITNILQQIVPVVYQRKSSDSIIVNQFFIQFQVTINNRLEISIVSAQIRGQYNKDIAKPSALFHTHVTYQNIFQRFVSYNLPVFYYFIYALLIDFVVMVSIWYAVSNIVIIDIKHKIECIFTPALKGSLYTILSGGAFLFFLNQITYQTNFVGITPLYGDDLSDETLELNNIGRNGLMIGFIGLYLLSTGVKQSFKITQNADLKTFFEDDLKLKKEDGIEGQDLSQRIEFTKKNMVSHKKYIFISSLFIILFGYFYVEITVSLPNYIVAILMIVAAPILGIVMIQYIRFSMIKELLYACGYALSFLLFFTILVLRNRSLAEFTYLYFCKFMYFYVETYLTELIFDKGMKRIDQLSEQNIFLKFLNKVFKTVIDSKRKQSQYQKSLYLSSIVITEILAAILTPLICLTMYIISRNNIFQITILLEQGPLYRSLVMIVAFVPLEIYTIFLIIELLKKYNYRIEEVIRLNRFKFQRRKFKWINDEFSHSSNIDWYYRQYEKFSFSSYLYFIVSLLGYSIFLIFLGMIIVVEAQYKFVYDPGMIIIGITVAISGDVLSFALSYVAVKKLKLYEKRDVQFMRQNLNKTQKYLKNNDMNDFLELQGVKEYFIIYNKEWIVQNLHRIFERQDLQQNNGEIISQYKHYKSLFKKKEMQQKRKLKELRQTTYHMKPAQLIQQNKIILSKKTFQLTKPIMYYWLYLAKQNIYLKKIISCVKDEKIKRNCQFCNMAFELEALQKRDFQQLVNQYRVLNVNKFFDPQTFLQFYRINQKYVTICIECKQKNLHLKNRITTKQVSSKLMKKWHFIAKSMILHQKGHKK